MSSGFSGGGAPDFFTAAGSPTGRSASTNNNNQQNLYRSNFTGVSMDPSSQINNGKRTLAEFQSQNLQQHQHQQQSMFNLPQYLQQNQQQQQQLMSMYLRSVKPRIYQNSSPLSPLSPVDFSGSPFPANLTGRYEIPMIQQLRSHHMNLNPQKLSSILVQRKALVRDSETEMEKTMMNQLQDLEKELLDDNDTENHDISVVTGSEWSDTIQSLIIPNQKIIPLSPTSSSSTSSSSTSVVSPAPMSSKESLMVAAAAISEGRSEAAAEIITRLSKQGPEQRIVHYMTAALKSRLIPTEYPPPVSELFGKEQMESTQLLFHHSSPFELGFMAANLVIIEASSEVKTLHIVDFNIGQGLQYQNLLQLPSLRKSGKLSLIKITAVEDAINGDKDKLTVIGKKLTQIAEQVGIKIQLTNTSVKISELTRESLSCTSDETLVVNFAYTLFKIPDESVSTENPRDQLLRRVKGLHPRVVTLIEQEMNCNTTQFISRVNECYSYYGALFDSMDALMAMNNSDRVKLDEGLGRKISNSVACEGKERVERCEVFGKWRARMGMAGFKPDPITQLVVDSLRVRVNSEARGNPLMVKEENGGVQFGWKGKTLTVMSAWR